MTRRVVVGYAPVVRRNANALKGKRSNNIMDAKLGRWNWRLHLRSAEEAAAMTDGELSEAVRNASVAAEKAGLPRVLYFLYQTGPTFIPGPNGTYVVEVRDSSVVVINGIRAVYDTWGIALGEWIDTVYDAYDKAWEYARKDEEDKKRKTRRDLESRLTGQ